MEGKGPHVSTDETSSEPSRIQRNHLRDPDQAYQFLAKLGATDGAESQINLKALRRKIDFRIIPIMFLCYTMQFIDKVALNVIHFPQCIPFMDLFIA